MANRPPALTLREWQLVRLVLEDHETSEIDSDSPKGAAFARQILTKIDARITHMQAAQARTTHKGTTP